jgi:hypothetical protein
MGRKIGWLKAALPREATLSFRLWHCYGLRQ